MLRLKLQYKNKINYPTLKSAFDLHIIFMSFPIQILWWRPVLSSLQSIVVWHMLIALHCLSLLKI